MRRPAPYDLHTRLRELERRVRELEGAVQRIGSATTTGTSRLYDAQQLYNPGFEQGFTRWSNSWIWGTASNEWRASTVDALSGTTSARATFDTRGSTQTLEHNDNFTVKTGETYRLQATVRHDWTAETVKIACYLQLAATEAGLDDWDTRIWVEAAGPLVTANSFVRIDGEAVVPAGYTWANFVVHPERRTTTNGGADTAGVMNVWVDDCSMQRKL